MTPHLYKSGLGTRPRMVQWAFAGIVLFLAKAHCYWVCWLGLLCFAFAVVGDE